MASMDFGGAFDELAESDFWIDAAMVLGGFLAPAVVRNVVEGRLGQDLPDEAYGVATAAGAEAFGAGHMVTLGAGAYTADALARRFGVRSTVTGLGA